MNIKKYFRLARKEAVKSCYKQKVGACLVTRRGEIFLGVNDHIKTHPFSPSPYGNIHAEFSALRKLHQKYHRDYLKVAKNSTIFIYRAMKIGTGLAKPCEDCLPILNAYGVKRIFYTDYEGYCEYTNAKV